MMFRQYLTVIISIYYDVVVNKGVGTFAISDLEMGTYDVQAIFDGDNKHLGNSSDFKQLEVNRIPTSLAVSIDGQFNFKRSDFRHIHC